MGPGAEAGTTRDVTPPSRDGIRPSFAKFIRPQKNRGRREDRVRAAPAVSRAMVDNKTHTSIQVQRKQSGLPCAMVLQLIPCSPRRDHSLFVTVAPKKTLEQARAPCELDTCHRGVRTTRLCRPRALAFVFRKLRVHRILPARFVTCATPLSSGGTAPNTQLIWVRSQE
jgi:hypothetical protein